MEESRSKTEEVAIFLGDKRFELGRNEVRSKLTQFLEEGTIDQWQLDEILDYDLDLEIKYRTFKKCISQFFLGLFFISFGLIVGSFFPLVGLFALLGIIISISAFFGLSPNKLSKKEIKYLKE